VNLRESRGQIRLVQVVEQPGGYDAAEAFAAEPEVPHVLTARGHTSGSRKGRHALGSVDAEDRPACLSGTRGQLPFAAPDIEESPGRLPGEHRPQYVARIRP